MGPTRCQNGSSQVSHWGNSGGPRLNVSEVSTRRSSQPSPSANEFGGGPKATVVGVSACKSNGGRWDRWREGSGGVIAVEMVKLLSSVL